MSSAGSSETRVPALELPFELISDIFTLCLPFRRRVRPHRNRAPLNLSSVCRQWRAVALGTPQLWASVHLRFTGRYSYEGIANLFSCSDEPVQEDQSALLVDLWFSRAADRPLSISVICNRKQSLPPNLMDVLSVYHSRWGRVELAMPMCDFQVFSRISGPFPFLKTLAIHVTDNHAPLSDRDVPAVCQSPNLQVLQLSDFLNAPMSLDVASALPHSLTALSVSRDGISMEAYLRDIFSLFPDLRDLDLFSHDGLVAHEESRIVAPLRSLLVEEDIALDLFIIPTLEHLRAWISSPTPLIDFLARSQCRLTTLTIGIDVHISNDTLSTCLSAVPELRILQLDVRTTQISNAMMRCKVLLENAELVPQLCVLYVGDWAAKPDYPGWVELLRGRRKLRHAHLHVWPAHPHVGLHLTPPSHDVVEQLEALRAERRMNISIITPTISWPWNAKDEDLVGDLDINIFSPGQNRPYFFSPF
ncbi:F-box domain-containing protein [Favolaschia claudopus]|uniref:F-box domain-containing protein n=1 Tax=Favolaschia claudopus TaxID=2862362 RepID=A0AAW0CBR2_9AGAR